MKLWRNLHNCAAPVVFRNRRFMVTWETTDWFCELRRVAWRMRPKRMPVTPKRRT